MQVNFGTGILAFIPTGANPTPVICGVLQEIALKTKQSEVKLYGQFKFPVDIAEGEGDVSGTAKCAQIYGAFFKQALSGSTIATGQKLGAIGEIGVVPTTPFTVTVVNAATWDADLSVYDATAGKPMTRVASAPTTGQYAVTAGAYLFAAADVAHVMQLNYSYTATTGQTVSLTNGLMGQANAFTLMMFQTYAAKGFGAKAFNVRIPGIDLALKNNAFMMTSLDFSCAADASGNVIEFYSAE